MIKVGDAVWNVGPADSDYTTDEHIRQMVAAEEAHSAWRRSHPIRALTDFDHHAIDPHETARICSDRGVLKAAEVESARVEGLRRKRAKVVQGARRALARREYARRSLLGFMDYLWWMPHDFEVGYHTRVICERLTRAVDDYLEGISTCLVIEVPFRHGKSDAVSIALPAWFLGRCAELQPDAILTGYGAELVEGFSGKCKSVISDERYGGSVDVPGSGVFPGMSVENALKSSVGKWSMTGSAGVVTAVGLGGSITGKGGSLIVLDDYCKKREEAESETYRRKVWASFTDDVMTRRAPASIVVVCATPWHIDGPTGRIQREMKANPDFPEFEFLTFPARSKTYPSGYLFPERFDEKWYLEQYATLGRYSSAGLLDCDPQAHEGHVFDTSRVKIQDDEGFPDTRYVRFWDLASTKKERAKDDPDFTVGALVGITRDGLVPHLWIKDVVAGQWEAPQRDRRIIGAADRDGGKVGIGVESVAGYKDTYENLKTILRGQRRVKKVNVSGDKMVRAADMEPIFEAGNVHLTKGSWNEDFLNQFARFPNGVHDDMVDAVSGAFHMLKKIFAMITRILFKIYHILEKNSFKLAESILKKLNSEFIIVSFPIKTISNKKMNFPYYPGFERLLKRLNFKYKKLLLKNELFFIINRNI